MNEIIFLTWNFIILKRGTYYNLGFYIVGSRLGNIANLFIGNY